MSMAVDHDGQIVQGDDGLWRCETPDGRFRLVQPTCEHWVPYWLDLHARPDLEHWGRYVTREAAADLLTRRARELRP